MSLSPLCQLRTQPALTDADTAYMRVQSQHVDCTHLQPTPSTSTPSAILANAQSALRDLGGSYVGLPLSGTHDEATREALSRFQEGHGLPVTGTLDDATASRIGLEVARTRDARAAAAELHDEVPSAAFTRGAVIPQGPFADMMADRVNQQLTSARADRTEALLSPSPSTRAHSGFIEAFTTSQVPASQRAVFDLIEQANQATESSGLPVWSGLRTTAGFPAAFGTAQLNVLTNLEGLRRIPPRVVAELGLDISAVRTMETRGRAAFDWFNTIAGRDRGNSDAANARTLGVTPPEFADIRARVSTGDFEGVAERYGDRFEAATGIDGAALRDLVESSLFRRADLQSAFEGSYRRTHNVAFDPEHRNSTRMAEALGAMLDDHPELQGLTDRMGAPSVSHYLGCADRQELGYGWATRAIAGEGGQAGLEPMLRAIDGLSSRARHVRNFKRAVGVMAKVRDVGGEARTRLLGRLSRLAHGSPESIHDHFEVNPPTSRAEVDAAFNTIRQSARRRRSDDNFVRQLDRVLR